MVAFHGRYSLCILIVTFRSCPVLDVCLLDEWMALGFFAVRKIIRAETNIFSYGELSHSEVSSGEKSAHGDEYVVWELHCFKSFDSSLPVYFFNWAYSYFFSRVFFLIGYRFISIEFKLIIKFESNFHCVFFSHWLQVYINWIHINCKVVSIKS